MRVTYLRKSDVMKIEILEDNDKAFRFRLSGADHAAANALRRIAMNSVKTFAIDKVTIHENSTAMFDEYIAHRIGLVPILTPSKGYSDTDEILFTLDKWGKGTIYSRDLVTSDKVVKVANGNIPIMKLDDEQKLRLEGKAVMGTGMGHAKFQPGIVTYEMKDESTYEFYVETFGQMPSKEIVNKALEVIKQELKDVEKGVKKL